MNSTQDRLSSKSKWLLVFSIALLAAMAYFQYQGSNFGDKNWLLLAARLWLGGKRLYVDIIEVNPPFIIWLYTLPATISLITGIQDNHVLVIIVFLLIGLSSAVCMRVMSYHSEFACHRTRQTYFLMLLGGVFVCWVYRVYFADREHLFIVLVFPYLLRWLPSISAQRLPKSLSLIIGALAAIGFCIKPHCMVIFAAVQLLYWARERSLRILYSMENIFVYVAALLYLAVVYLYFPEYFYTILRMALATYSGYNSGSAIPIQYIIPPVFTLAVALADFRLRHQTPYRRDIFYFLGLCAAALLYGLLNNGWGYTYLPLSSCALFTVGLIGWEFLWLKENAVTTPQDSKSFAFGFRACVISLGVNTALMVFYVAYLGIAAFLPEDALTHKAYACVERFNTAIKQTPRNSFGAISLSSYLWPELVHDTGARMDTRYNHFWMLPKFSSADAVFKKKYEWIVRDVEQGITDDLNQNKPGIVFVEMNLKSKKPYFMDIFATYPAFVEAWAHYSLQETPEECGFRVYKRIL